ncbi:MAG TPA: ATP-binding protein [Thermomicrobiales bacterium]|nr:ATP-binding protein [Thermomicrobiales bacterium]
MRSIGDIIKELERSIPRNTGVGGPPAAEPDEEVCPICKGAGYVRFEVPITDPNFGRLIPCECRIRERERRKHEELLRIGNLGPFEHKTFESFDPGVNRDVAAARDIAVAYARDPKGTGTPWIFFHGNCGTGKTHLAAAIANYYITHQGGRALFTIVPDLLDHLRATFNPSDTGGVTYDQLFQDVRSVPLLILDDLGTENATPWAKEKLFQIFNHRYNEGLATVVTSNHDFEQIDARIVSRLSDTHLCRYVLIDAPDYRRHDNPAFGGLRRPSTRGGRRGP